MLWGDLWCQVAKWACALWESEIWAWGCSKCPGIIVVFLCLTCQAEGVNANLSTTRLKSLNPWKVKVDYSHVHVFTVLLPSGKIATRSSRTEPLLPDRKFNEHTFSITRYTSVFLFRFLTVSFSLSLIKSWCSHKVFIFFSFIHLWCGCFQLARRHSLNARASLCCAVCVYTSACTFTASLFTAQCSGAVESQWKTEERLQKNATKKEAKENR